MMMTWDMRAGHLIGTFERNICAGYLCRMSGQWMMKDVIAWCDEDAGVM